MKSISNMPKKVTIVEINNFEKMFPLVGSYLQSYACTVPAIKEAYDFKKLSLDVYVPYTQILQELIEHDSDIYAFSCYIWNMELVKRLLPPLLESRPNIYILLGGPQVMNQSKQYLTPQNEKMLICNGEGEKTFASFLQELLKPKNEINFSNVKGLSFYKDNALITTEPQERIKELDGIPSPYLNDNFDENYLWAVLETNRGCPFKCSFCFWGAATNDRLYKYSEERIKTDISCISQNGIPFIFIADANWGILKRDISFSEHIAKCKKENFTPVHVSFSAAKNSPQRVSEITEIFTESGLIHSHPISLQSLNETSLELVDRKNIKLSAYQQLQEDLNEREINSFIELMFPLPGETLESFIKGIEILFEREASLLVIYPHLLLLNTPMYENKDKHKLVTRKVNNNISEENLIVGTANITEENFNTGMWFIHTVMALFNTRSIHRLSYYLHNEGLELFSSFYLKFIQFCMNDQKNAFSILCKELIEKSAFSNADNQTEVYHLVLHQHRREFDLLLYQFVKSQPWWDNINVQVLFEFDMLTKAYIYNNTPVSEPDFPLKNIQLIDIKDNCYIVKIPISYSNLLGFENETKEARTHSEPALRISIDHKRSQSPYHEVRSKRKKADLVNGNIRRIRDLHPTFESGH